MVELIAAADIAADEDRIRRRLAIEDVRQIAGNDFKTRCAQPVTVGFSIISMRSLLRSKAIAAAPSAARIHSMAMEPHPRPDVPQERPGCRLQSGQRDGAHFALGQLAVVDKGIVGQAGRARQYPRRLVGYAFDGESVQAGAGRGWQLACSEAQPAFLFTAHVFKDVEAAFAKSAFDKPAGDLDKVGRTAGEHK